MTQLPEQRGSQGEQAASPHSIFGQCPHCDGQLQPEHAHYRCAMCGWRDSCCD